MAKLIFLRHGQSLWNLENKFTGWTDVDLSPHGEREALRAGAAIAKDKIHFDIAFSSVLRRAVRTLHLAERSAGQFGADEIRTWRLNERHYGALQGLDKALTAQKYGAEQVKIWRRSFDIPPPYLSADDPRSPRIDPLYSSVPKEMLPLGESLKDTLIRVMPFWEQCIRPQLEKGKNVLVAAHGNSIRAMLKYLKHISDSDIVSLEIPTGTPIVLSLDSGMNIEEEHILG